MHYDNTTLIHKYITLSRQFGQSIAQKQYDGESTLELAKHYRLLSKLVQTYYHPKIQDVVHNAFIHAYTDFMDNHMAPKHGKATTWYQEMSRYLLQ